jgi:hypothetical protein
MNGSAATLPSNGTRLLKMAVVYLMLGLVLGIAMAASHQFELRPVHTHVHLLGWVTMALAGVIYCVFPRVAASRLAVWHFWLHQSGLPVMMLGLAAYSLGQVQFEPMIAAGSLAVTAGLSLFAANLLLNLGAQQEKGDAHAASQGVASA